MARYFSEVFTEKEPRNSKKKKKKKCFKTKELFYDIFYVVVISQLTHFELAGWKDIGIFVALFIAVWWAWVSVAFYATRFDTDDLFNRVLILIQIFGVGKCCSH